MLRSKQITLRVNSEELQLMKDIPNETLSNILREGLQLYFDNEANKKCKRKGIKVWKES